METVLESYRWVVWKNHKQEIIDLYAHFDIEDWNLRRSAIDSWIDDHFDAWLKYSTANYRAPAAVKTELDQSKAFVAGRLS